MKRPDRPAPEPAAPQDQIIPGHRYDGIQEYDNPMPRWWINLFWATIAFSVAYVVAIRTGGIDTYEADLSQQTAALTATREAYAAQHPAFSADAASLAAFAANPDNAAAGAVLFAATCASCHGSKGEGTIGPNLTDDYWLHGAQPADVYAVITNGVVEKGMPAWQSAVSDEDRGKLVAYIVSLHGTNPPGAKPPQGDKVTG